MLFQCFNVYGLVFDSTVYGIERDVAVFDVFRIDIFQLESALRAVLERISPEAVVIAFCFGVYA